MSPVSNEMVRRALTDTLTWEILTADEAGRDIASEWLTNAAMKVRTDRKIKQAQSVAERAALIPSSREWHQANARFAEWNARSRGFERLVVERLRDLGLNEQGHPIRKEKIDEVERMRAHADLMDTGRRMAVEALADLASLVEACFAGDVSIEDLDAALDDLTVDGTCTLRELVAGIRAKLARKAGVS